MEDMTLDEQHAEIVLLQDAARRRMAAGPATGPDSAS
jgi:hypothetical protein